MIGFAGPGPYLGPIPRPPKPRIFLRRGFWFCGVADGDYWKGYYGGSPKEAYSLLRSGARSGYWRAVMAERV